MTVRQPVTFKIIAALITISLLAIFLFGYSVVIFTHSDGLSDIKYNILLGIGLLGILLWGKMSVGSVKEIKALRATKATKM